MEDYSLDESEDELNDLYRGLDEKKGLRFILEKKWRIDDLY